MRKKAGTGTSKLVRAPHATAAINPTLGNFAPEPIGRSTGSTVGFGRETESVGDAVTIPTTIRSYCRALVQSRWPTTLHVALRNRAVLQPVAICSICWGLSVAQLYCVTVKHGDRFTQWPLPAVRVPSPLPVMRQIACKVLWQIICKVTGFKPCHRYRESVRVPRALVQTGLRDSTAQLRSGDRGLRRGCG